MAKKASIISDICPNGYPAMSPREKSLFQQLNNLPALPDNIATNRCIQKSWIKPNDPIEGGWFDFFQQVTYNDSYYPYIPDLVRTKTINNIYSKGDYSAYNYIANTKDQIVSIDLAHEDMNISDVLVDINFAVDSVDKIIDNISGLPVHLAESAELFYNKDYDSWGVIYPSNENILASMSTIDTKFYHRLASGEMTGYIIILEVEQINHEKPVPFLITPEDGICALSRPDISSSDELIYICPITNDENGDGYINLKFLTICNDIRSGFMKMFGDNHNDEHNIESWKPEETGLFAAEEIEQLYIACKRSGEAFSNCIIKRFMIIDKTIYQSENPREVLHIDFSLSTPKDLIYGRTLNIGTCGQYNVANKYWYKNISSGTNLYALPIAWIKLSDLPIFKNTLLSIINNGEKYRITCEAYQVSSASNANMNIMAFTTQSPTDSVTTKVGAFGLAGAMLSNASSTIAESNLFRYNVSFKGGNNHNFQCFKYTTKLSDSDGSGTSYALKELNASQLNNYYIVFGCGNASNNPGGYTYLKSVIVEKL